MPEHTAAHRVLIIAKAYPPTVGGVESYSEFIARAYLAQGVEPVVISSWGGRRGWEIRRHPEGDIHILNVGEGPQILIFARFVMAFVRLRLTQTFDVLHATTWRPALAVMPWRGQAPVVLTVHAQEVSNCPPAQRQAMTYVLKNVDQLNAVSDATMAVTKAEFGTNPARGKWQVNFNGLSYIEEAKTFERPRRSHDTPTRILSFCRLAERKNIKGCLDAIARLRDEGIINFEYIIAGNGPLKEEISSKIEDLNLSEFVKMAGYVRDDDIPGLYSNADIFLHPQTAPNKGRDLEGFGLAIADAMSFGAAAIVGKDGGPPNFVKHGERGLVVDGNEIDQITAALRQLLTDASERRRLAQNGRQWCLSNLSWDRHVAAIITSLDLDGDRLEAPEQVLDR